MPYVSISYVHLSSDARLLTGSINEDLVGGAIRGAVQNGSFGIAADQYDHVGLERSARTVFMCTLSTKIALWIVRSWTGLPVYLRPRSEPANSAQVERIRLFTPFDAW